MFVGFTASIFAQVAAPTNLTATPTEEGHILLQWEIPSNSQVDYFKVYRGTDTLFWTELGTTYGNWTQFRDYNVISGVEYNYYVRSFLGFEGYPSNKVSQKATSGGKSISITSVPSTAMKTGILYQYLIKTTDNEAQLEYSLIEAPDNMIIDENGLISWTNKSITGRIPVIVAVKVKDTLSNIASSIKAVQKFVLQVASKITGTIQGKVVDERSNNGINGVKIRFYEANNNEFTYDVRTDANGNYQLTNMSAGDYYIYVKAPDAFESYWYPNAKDLNNAQKITFEQENPSIIQFNLRLKSSDTAPISGKVTDTLGNTINSATVYFIDASKYLNIGQDDHSVDIFIDGGNEYITAHKSTDENGNYEVEVITNKSYFVVCKKADYYSTYFNNQSNILGSSKLFVNSDLNGIDFKLIPKTRSNNTVEGRVIKSDLGEGIASRIILTKRPRGGGGGHVPFKFDLSPSFKTVNTDLNGKFTIDNIDEDQYMIQAVPLGDYLPTYYTPDTTSNSVKWFKADSIYTLGSVSGTLVIRTLPAVTDGIGSFSGRIKTSLGENVGGAIVYAFSGETPVAYGITDSLGYYLIKGLRTGTYSIYVDKYDYQISAEKFVEINNNQIPISKVIDIILNPVNPSIVYRDPDPLPSPVYQLYQNYPNPFNPTTTIEYKLERDGNVELKIYDVLGREVKVLSDQIQLAGSYKVVFDAKDLSSGMYFVTLRVYNNNRTVYFEKKKMILTR
jgi:hypothetical protein